jgi:NADH-quinone oxidoreductase subunit C
LELTQIHALLTERFEGAIAPLATPEAGDPWIGVRLGDFYKVCQFLKDEPSLAFNYLRLISGVDYTDRFASVYHLYSYTHGHGLTLHVDLPREDPRVASVAALWPTADWHERETYDLMGIVYEGHPALTRIFLPDDWLGHPLRKDYKSPEEYHGISNE